jgi:hypothetical protein
MGRLVSWECVALVRDATHDSCMDCGGVTEDTSAVAQEEQARM